MGRQRNALGTKCVLTILLCQKLTNESFETPIASRISTCKRHPTTRSPVRALKTQDTNNGHHNNISNHQRSQHEGLSGFILAFPNSWLFTSPNAAPLLLYPDHSAYCASVGVVRDVGSTFSFGNERYAHGTAPVE